jgi:hypothetical protein
MCRGLWSRFIRFAVGPFDPGTGGTSIRLFSKRKKGKERSMAVAGITPGSKPLDPLAAIPVVSSLCA